MTDDAARKNQERMRQQLSSEEILKAKEIRKELLIKEKF